MRRIIENKTDFSITAAILALAVYGLVTAAGFQAGSRVWPIVILSMLILCTSIYLAIFLLGSDPREVSEKARIAANDDPIVPDNPAKIIINVVLITALIIAAPIVGLFVSAAVYLLAHMIYLGIRPLWLSLFCALGGTAIIYAFFGLALGVSIPRVWLF